MPPPHPQVFWKLANGIHSMMLKLSVAVHSSIVGISICQPCVHNFWYCLGDRIITWGLAKYRHFDKNILFFFHFHKQNYSIRILLHALSNLAWICMNFYYSLTSQENVQIQDDEPKTPDLMTSYDIITKKYLRIL